jgi:chromosome segregation ATPase
MLKLDGFQRQITELNSHRNKLHFENTDLLKQIEENEASLSAFSKIKHHLLAQIEDARRVADEECRARNSLAQQLKSANLDLVQASDQLEEETSIRVDAQKIVIKLTADVQHWRTKYETESLARAEELEETKKKLTSKLAEAEEKVEQALAKCNSMEKIKLRLKAEVEDLMVDVERANANASTMEKKQKQFDKLIAEWKQKCEGMYISKCYKFI